MSHVGNQRCKPDDLYYFYGRQQKPCVFCYHFKRPPGLRLAFDRAERNRKFGHAQCQRNKEQQQRKDKEISSLEKNSES